MKKIVFCFLGLVLMLMLACPICCNSLTKEGEALRADSEMENYFTIYDYSEPDKVVLIKGESVQVDDEYLSQDNKLYRIVSVDNKLKTGKAEFICDEKLPKYNVQRVRNNSEVVAESKKKVGLYHTHNDECYLDADGTDSVYGKGGIHDIGKEFKSKLESKNIEVVYNEDLHLPHNSGAYTRSQVTASKILETGGIDALFDLHRDSTPRSEYLTTIDGTEMSKVRMVVGSANQNYYENKEFAYKIKAYADEVYPGLIKDIYMGKGNYNQQLLSRGMLFEMGCEKIEKDLVIKSVVPLTKVIDVVLYGSSSASKESMNDVKLAITETGETQEITGIVEKKSTKSISFIWILLSGIAFYFIVLGIVCIFSKETRYKTKRFFQELFLIRKLRK